MAFVRPSELGRKQVEFFSPDFQEIRIYVLLPATMTAPGQLGTEIIVKTIEGAILTRKFESDTDALKRFVKTIKNRIF